MEKDMYWLISKRRQGEELVALEACNEKTEQFGLILSKEQQTELIQCRNESLKKYERVELGRGILDQIIFCFCDSQFLNQENYSETLKKLQDIFYQFKNEAMDQLTDEELLNFMREQFDKVCGGDTDYLAGTCLERFSEAIRSGYTGYVSSSGRGEYEQFDQEQRWDSDLYDQVAKELFW